MRRVAWKAGSLALIIVGLVSAHPRQGRLGGEANDIENGAQAKLSRLNPGFIENRGQWRSPIRYVAKFADMTVRAEPGSIVVQQARSGEQPQLAVVKMTFENGGATEPRGGQPAKGALHYLKGPDRSAWRHDVPAFHDVLYSGVHEGVDVRLREQDGRLEYDVLVSPTGNIDDFTVYCEGIDGLTLEASGELRLHTPVGPLVQHPPVAWQVAADGETFSARCRFRLLDERRFGLELADRVPGSSVVIDPGLTWATFLGGAASDYALAVRVLPTGHVLVAGTTDSPDFPTTPGVFDGTLADSDATISCLDPTGSELVFATYLGGSDRESASALDLASDGSIAFGGFTESADFPVSAQSFDQTLGGSTDTYVAMLTPDGSDLLYSTYLGGTGPCLEAMEGLAITSTGLIVCAGLTCNTTGFPTTPTSFQPAPGGGIDGFVTWLDPSRAGFAQLVCSSYLGGTDSDEVEGFALSAAGEPILVGPSTSANFPTTAGAFDVTSGGDFITRVSADGSALVASTRFKPATLTTVASDGESILISGRAGSGLPVTANAFDTTWNGGFDGCVVRFDGQLSQILAATYLGGGLVDTPTAIAVDDSGGVVIAGSTQSANYPTTPGAFDTEFGGIPPMGTSMVSYLSGELSELLYSSFLGPALALASHANDVDVYGAADVAIVGQGAQSGFPVTPGSYDVSFNGGGLGDAYVARMLLTATWSNLGGGVLGANGTPSLTGTGSLAAGTNVTLTLRHALPNASATLIVGIGLLGAPFKGGTLVPSPTLLIFGLPINGNGSLSVQATWPPGLPSGFTTYFQCWIADAAAPAGLSASNGLSGTTP